MGNHHSNPKPKFNIPGFHPKLPHIPNPVKPIIKPIERTVGIIKDKITDKRTYQKMLKQLANSPATIDKKIDFMINKLDDSTNGYGSTALALAVPEVFVVKGAVNAINDIKNGKPPRDALQTIAINLLVQNILGNEIRVLRVPSQAYRGKEVRERLLNTPVGRKVMDRVKQKMPDKIKKLID